MKRIRLGFSLIELLIALVVFSILMALGMPTFTNYIRDAKLRAAAETFLSGVQLARSEALRRNANVEFLLTAAEPIATNVGAAAAAAGPHWIVRSIGPQEFIEGKSAAEGNGTSVLSINDGTVPAVDDPDPPPATPVASITFDGLGRTDMGADAAFKITSPQALCRTAGGPVRCLRVTVSRFGQARLCDPAVGNQDTRSCQ